MSKAERLIQSRRKACADQVRANPNARNPETLARSYGLEIADVERIIRNVANA